MILLVDGGMERNGIQDRYDLVDSAMGEDLEAQFPYAFFAEQNGAPILSCHASTLYSRKLDL
jgi:hypothetical protein